jgi:hypothetical protein
MQQRLDGSEAVAAVALTIVVGIEHLVEKATKAAK